MQYELGGHRTASKYLIFLDFTCRNGSKIAAQVMRESFPSVFSMCL
jgi:hypothetical protein